MQLKPINPGYIIISGKIFWSAHKNCNQIARNKIYFIYSKMSKLFLMNTDEFQKKKNILNE